MKNTIFLLLAAVLFTVSVQAQTTVDSIAAKYKLVPMPEPLTIEKTFPVLGTYQLAGTDASMATTTSVATDNTSASTNNGSVTTSYSNNVTVTLDSVNKGIIWVEGLPQGKFKAYLKKSPATYRVLAQKTESGNQIPEGTLMFDPESKTLSVALGKEFDEADPAAIFALNPALAPSTANTDVAAPADNTVKVKVKTATTKSKSKVSYFTATKLEQQTTTSSDATAPATQSQPAQQ